MKRLLLLLFIIFSLTFSQAQCPPVTNLGYSNYTGTTVDIQWVAGGTETEWQLEFGPVGFTPGTGAGTVSLNTAPNSIIFGITPNTVYEVYVTAICGPQAISTALGPLLVPGNYNTITGTVTYDQDINGCSISDPTASGLQVTASATNSNGLSTALTDSSGSYTILVPDGNYDLNVQLNNSSISTAPTITNITFPNATSSFNQDFCLTPIVLQEDISVTILPITQARPGFDTSYRVVLSNQSTLPVTDVLTFNYESDYMTLLTAVPTSSSSTTSSLSWNYTLNPFQVLYYDLDFNLNPPTHPTFPLNSNDILNLSASTYLTGADVDLGNNTFDLDQTVVNSYDPNDKTCLQGETIDPGMIGEYLDYLIRFENTGTASAINVRIKDLIDTSKFDINSLVPLDASHEYYMSITNGNEVEFHFDNINLDFNDATNDGYVLFKIRTLNSLVDGDSFDNTAEIYFDFNFPIITNTETVTVMSTSSVDDATDISIKLFPNPASSEIYLSSEKSLHSATIVDINGRVLSQVRFRESVNQQNISIHDLSDGIYFVTIKSEIGHKTEKLIVQ